MTQPKHSLKACDWGYVPSRVVFTGDSAGPIRDSGRITEQTNFLLDLNLYYC